MSLAFDREVASQIAEWHGELQCLSGLAGAKREPYGGGLIAFRGAGERPAKIENPVTGTLEIGRIEQANVSLGCPTKQNR